MTAVPLSFIAQNNIRSRTHFPVHPLPGLTANDPSSLKIHKRYSFRSQRY